MSKYRVKLFAQLKDRVGSSIWSCEVDGKIRTSELLEKFFLEFSDLAKLKTVTRVAVNEEFCVEDRELDGLEELAFIPPVSGG